MAVLGHVHRCGRRALAMAPAPTAPRPTTLTCSPSVPGAAASGLRASPRPHTVRRHIGYYDAACQCTAATQHATHGRAVEWNSTCRTLLHHRSPGRCAAAA